MSIKIIESIADIPAAQWDALAGNNPFLSHAYLCALQESGCATPDTGWHAQFLTLWQDDKLLHRHNGRELAPRQAAQAERSASTRSVYKNSRAPPRKSKKTGRTKNRRL